jgi:hypothetical protein
LVTTVLSSVGLVLAGAFAEIVGLRQTLIGAAAIVAVATVVPLVSRTVRRADASHARSEPASIAAPEPVIVLPDPPRPVEVTVSLPDPPAVWAHSDRV